MKKRIVILSGIILAVCLIAGIYRLNNQNNQNRISNRQRENISAAYNASEGRELYWYETDGMGAYYLTTVNGCIVFYNLRTWNPYANVGYEYNDMTDVFISERVRFCFFTLLDSRFSPAFENQLYVYKGGKVTWLTKAWMNGWIKDEDVQVVKEAYDTFIQQLIDMGEDEYLNREKQFRTTLYSISGYDPTYDNFMKTTSSTEYRTFLSYINDASEN